MKDGWIKLHRKILDWEWYDAPNTFRLFLHLLLTANHTDKKYRGILVKRGSAVIGRIKLAEDLGLTEQQVRTAITKLKSTSEITSQSTNQFTVVTVVNYDRYQQDNQPINKRTTNKQPTDNHIQECKNEKNIRNTPPYPPSALAKRSNNLSLTRSQMLALLKEFPGVTSSEMKEQVEKCNSYMTISSMEYKNPGLFFRAWLKRYMQEKQKRAETDKQRQEITAALQTISEEQRQRNLQRLDKIKSSSQIKEVSAK